MNSTYQNANFFLFCFVLFFALYMLFSVHYMTTRISISSLRLVKTFINVNFKKRGKRFYFTIIIKLNI